MNKNFILSALVVLVLVGGGVYFSSMKSMQDSSNVTENNSLTEQNVVGDLTQTGDTENSALVSLSIAPESKATYEIDENLNGKPTHVVGTTSSLSGSVMFDTVSKKITSAEVNLDANSFKTDIDKRDENVREHVLKSEVESNKFITFKTSMIEGMTENAETGTVFPVKITGDLTIKGVTKSVTFSGQASVMSDNTVKVDANTTIMYGDFGVSIPNLPFLSNISKSVKLSVSIIAK